MVSRELRPNLPALPVNMRRLRVSRGFPVPYFVQWIDGQPEFRLTSPGAMQSCVLCRLCWICGKPLGRQLVSFISGPVSAINRLSGEPPQHLACAEFAVRVCPFLINPSMERRENGLPAKGPSPGLMLDHNPGVSALWICRNWEARATEQGYLFHYGFPVRVNWYREGRDATRAEARAALEHGVSVLRTYASAQEELDDLEKRYTATFSLLPKEQKGRL